MTGEAGPLLSTTHRRKCQRLAHWSRTGKEHSRSRCPSSGTRSICSPFQRWRSLPWTLLLTSMWTSATCQFLAGDQEAFLACQHLGNIVSNLWLTTRDYATTFPGWPTSQGCKCGGRGRGEKCTASKPEVAEDTIWGRGKVEQPDDYRWGCYDRLA